MKKFLSVAALAACLTGGGILGVQAAGCALGVPAAYAQMNSPGDGLTPGAARQGNSRPRRMRGLRRGGVHYHHRRHHRHFHHRRYR